MRDRARVVRSLRPGGVLLWLAVAGCAPVPDSNFGVTPDSSTAAGVPATVLISAETLAELQRTAAELADDPEDPRRAKFVAAVFPALSLVYADEAYADDRDAMLEIASLLAEPEAASLWAQALAVGAAGGIDGTVEGHARALLALQGIRAAQAEAAGDDVVAAFSTLLATPRLDRHDGKDGQLRTSLAMTLGLLRVEAGVRPLIVALETDPADQPTPVYRAAIDALGRIGDPAAVEALIAVSFTVPDAPSTQSVAERALRALGAIGELAVPALIETLEGRNDRINELAAAQGIDPEIVELTAMRMLGVIGSPTAVPAIVRATPTDDCGPGSHESDPSQWQRRAFAANTLGMIGDPAAVEVLCRCRRASDDPTDLWEITVALGRIGGDEAFACLADIVARGHYADADPSYVHEIRWEGARHLILAANPAQTAAVVSVIANNTTEVRAKFEASGYAAGLAVLDRCKRDRSCYEGVLLDVTRAWFEREVAAFNLARLASSGDLVVAGELARGFTTRDPDARTNIAWLTARVAAGQPCPECVALLTAVMDAEAETKDATMQPAWIMARQTVVKLGG